MSDLSVDIFCENLIFTASTLDPDDGRKLINISENVAQKGSFNNPSELIKYSISLIELSPIKSRKYRRKQRNRLRKIIATTSFEHQELEFPEWNDYYDRLLADEEK